MNKVPIKKEENSSYELWKGRKSSYKYLRVWGCLAKVVFPPPKKVKKGPKAVIAFSLVMQIIVVPTFSLVMRIIVVFISFLFMSRISLIFTRTHNGIEECIIF